MNRRVHILYRWWDANGALLYVGKSVSIVARIASHRASSAFFDEAVSMTMERFPDAEALGRAEVEAIRLEAPRYNKRGAARVKVPGAYCLRDFAAAVDLSIEKVRQHIERGELVPSYVDSKPLIMREEGERWLRTRPAERPNT